MLVNDIFLVIGAVSVLIWGIAHLFPTRNVVKGFGDISQDNKHIILMEWILEGVTLIFIGTLVLAVTFSNEPTGSIHHLVYSLCAALLVVMAIVSLFTGFKVKFLPFKLCPLIFLKSAILITLGAWL